ncbi:MAG: hypothetical protein ACRCTZ_03505 [Sarcina sp.]
MKFKKISIMTLGLASSLFLIGIFSCHESIKDEKVKVEVINGNLDVLGDDKLVFHDNNGINTENLVSVSKDGIENSTIKYKDNLILDIGNSGGIEGNFDESFKSDYKEMYSFIKESQKSKVWLNYNMNFNDETPYLLCTDAEKEKMSSEYKLTFAYYDNNTLKKEKIILERSDFTEQYSEYFSSIRPLTIDLENNILKFVSVTSIEAPLNNSNDYSNQTELYDYVEFNLKTKEHKVQNLNIPRIYGTSIKGDAIYTLAGTDEGIALNKINIKDVKKTETICNIDELFLKGNINTSDVREYFNTFRNRFEIFEIYEKKDFENKMYYESRMNVTIFDVETEKLKEYRDILIRTNDEIYKNLVLRDSFTSGDKLFLSYVKEGAFNTPNYTRVIDLNTKKEILTLKANTKYETPNILVDSGGNNEKK